MKSIISTCKKGFKAILSGITAKDKCIILISLLFAFFSRFIYRVFLKREPPAYGEFMVRDIIIRNEDGIFYCRRRDHDWSFVQPVWEKEIRDYFNLTEGVFIDCGAHIGKYTIMISRRLGGRGKVIAIEPDKDNYKVLLRNIELNNCKNVIPLNIGLWKEKGKLKLYDLDDKNTGMKSILPANTDFKIIEVDTLDSVLEKLEQKSVDLIKIDVEGVEVEVIEGYKKVVKQKPNIIFESWSERNCQTIQNILRTYRIDKTAMHGYYFAYVREGKKICEVD